MFDSLGDRMKTYERASRYVLPPRMPVIVRVDGKAFHTWTRGMERPFDTKLMTWMDRTAIALCEELQGARIAYVQSDEISVLLVNYSTHESQAWFDNALQKMVSVAASVATAAMAKTISELPWDKRPSPPHFDARAFVLPREEVTNYFLWRQNDASRNSVQMLARSLASHKECDGLGQKELQELCHARGQNWNDLPTRFRRGRCIVRLTYEADGATRHKWAIDGEIPIWKNEGREYIERLVRVDE